MTGRALWAFALAAPAQAEEPVAFGDSYGITVAFEAYLQAAEPTGIAPAPTDRINVLP